MHTIDTMCIDSGGTSLKSVLNCDGICVTCDKSAMGSSVTCFMCLKKFHAVGCTVSSSICTQTFLNLHVPLSEKTGVNDQRPGNFKFVCDICMTEFEKKQARRTSDEFTSLQNQVNKLDKSMKDIKELLMNPNRSSGNGASFADTASVDKQLTCWGNVDNANVNIKNNPLVSSPVVAEVNVENSTSSKSILVIENKENADVKKSALDMVEKFVVDCNIGIKNSYENKLGNTVVVCHSDEQRNVLETKIHDALPKVNVKSLNNFLNTSIAVVGFSPTYDDSNILDIILKQNHFVNDFIKLKGNGKVENHIKLLEVKPLKKNVNLSQAVFKVSASLRLLLKNKNDKLLVGIRSVTVYERFYVKRCFGCQKYGHIHSCCPTPDVKFCANCAGDHETKNCVNSSVVKCANCLRHGTSNVDHPASSSDCPVFCTELARVKDLN